ncbi:MAG: PorT family protein [Tenacibaculum sp.]|nr:PorT family protein [Tenacibaculum sp.]
MIKQFLFISTFLFSIVLSAQKDSLKVDDKYWEDQLYVNITYNTFKTQPKKTSLSLFSYGISAGYIKDIPLNKRRSWATGIGLGYGYNYYTHKLYFKNSNTYWNGFREHNIEFPIQLRWRNSNATTYSFWRIYAGVRLSYNFSNKLKYSIGNKEYSSKNISNYNEFQTGLELSIGYNAFNFYIYYGLTPMYKNMFVDKEKINNRAIKFGLIFYLL